MRKLLLILGLVLSLPGVTLADSDDHGAFLAFGSMYGVDGGFVNNNSIRGVLGDELPWQVKRASGVLTADGHLHISVRGLVFTNDPAVPPELRGINDEETFRGLVSCLSEGSGGGIVTINVPTRGFRATRSGNSEINDRVSLPAQCVAPIVFVMSGSEDKWFAVVGREISGN